MSAPIPFLKGQRVYTVKKLFHFLDKNRLGILPARSLGVVTSVREVFICGVSFGWNVRVRFPDIKEVSRRSLDVLPQYLEGYK